MTARTRPVDLPEIRADLLRHYQNQAVAEWWAKREAPPAMTLADDGETTLVLNPTGDARRIAEIANLELAELFFVSAPMTELAVTAAKSMPTFAVEEHDLPARRGLVIFETPIAKDRNFTGEDVFIAGVSWYVLANEALGPLLWFSFYIDNHLTMDLEAEVGRITVEEATRQKLGQPRYSYTTDGAHIIGLAPDPRDESVLNLWGRTIVATWLLMQQTLATDTEIAPPRAARKRLRRQGYEARSVRVIELRRSKASSEAGDGSRDYHHQWIVRGHWRQQWHPKRQVHRPVWIAPHVKGPEGAPLIGGEKVYALKR